jgi:hypothetical protein
MSVRRSDSLDYRKGRFMAVCSDDRPQLPSVERGTLADARFDFLTRAPADAWFATEAIVVLVLKGTNHADGVGAWRYLLSGSGTCRANWTGG